jgi:hypothetical protein
MISKLNLNFSRTTIVNKNLTIILLLMLISISCSREDDLTDPLPPANKPEAAVTVDLNEPLGEIMEIEKYNGSSTTSPLPGDASQKWLQDLNTKLTRVWIQLVFVYNNGNIDYNYRYSGSGVPVEDALAFYSTTSDSLLIVLSGHKDSGSFQMPEGEEYKDLVRETILHYKRKFPKIKYIQVSNEPDHGGETMATYYPVYKNYYRGLNEANNILKLENQKLGHSYDPVLLSNGAFTSNIPNMLKYAHSFFTAYTADTDPNKKLDFFTFNSYGESNRPLELLTARHRIDSTMQAHGLPPIPIFVTEYGLIGGSSLPSGLTLEEAVTMQPAGQLTKAFYFYEGGIDRVLNWSIHHSRLKHKSELLDLQNAYASPYGNALLLSKMLSERQTRVKAESKLIDNQGLGVHVLAAKGNNKGVAVLVWNFNWWRSNAGSQELNVEIKNIPQSEFGEKLNTQVYIIDSKNNNYYTNRNQTTLNTSLNFSYDYASSITVPLTLEKYAVALILITP